MIVFDKISNFKRKVKNYVCLSVFNDFSYSAGFSLSNQIPIMTNIYQRKVRAVVYVLF